MSGDKSQISFSKSKERNHSSQNVNKVRTSIYSPSKKCCKHEEELILAKQSMKDLQNQLKQLSEENTLLRQMVQESKANPKHLNFINMKYESEQPFGNVQNTLNYSSVKENFYNQSKPEIIKNITLVNDDQVSVSDQKILQPQINKYNINNLNTQDVKESIDCEKNNKICERLRSISMNGNLADSQKQTNKVNTIKQPSSHFENLKIKEDLNKRMSKRIPKLRLEVIPNFHGNNKQNKSINDIIIAQQQQKTDQNNIKCTNLY